MNFNNIKNPLSGDYGWNVQASSLLFLTVVIYAFFDTPLAYPLKMLVVFFHELSHLLAALATGGVAHELELNYRQGGHVVSSGGYGPITSSSGYLGSLLIGVFLFVISIKTEMDRAVVGLMGLLLLGITLWYGSDLFTHIFAGGISVAFLVSAWFMGHNFNDFILKVIGISSMLYAPWDIWSDTISRQSEASDASAFAEYTVGTGFFWGCVWYVISLLVILLTYKWFLSQSKEK